MKKINLASVLIFFAATTISAQSNDLAVRKDIKGIEQKETVIKKEKKEEKKELRKLEGQEVSYQSKQQFYTDFGNIPATWQRSSWFDVATFVKDGKEMKAYYDSDSQLVGTTCNKEFDDLPVEAQKYIDKKYKGYDKGVVVYFDDNEDNDMDMVMYDTRFDDNDMYFVELNKNNKHIILKVDTDGNVSFFTQLG